MRVIKGIAVLFFIVLVIISICLVFGCSQQKYLDLWGLKKDAKKYEDLFLPGDTASLRKFLRENTLDSFTNPKHLDNITITRSSRWKLPDVENLIVEKLSYPSDFKSNTSNDTAVFYIFRRGILSGNKVILWIPGMGVSDLAFKLIDRFFYEDLNHGYIIIFYIPPYHLDRKLKDKENGEGFFTTNTLDNISHFMIAVRELRTISAYLKSKNVKSINGWGGSMGASMELLLTRYVEFDHVCAMIPIIDWYKLVINNPYVTNIKQRLNQKGFDDKLLKEAYSLISPNHYLLKLNTQKTLFLFGKYDQISDLNENQDYAKSIGIDNIISYNRSHSTILLSGKMFEDYGRFLDSVK